MNLLYVFTSAGLIESSVQKKVKNQIQALNDIDVNCKGLFFTTEDIENASNELYQFIKVEKIESGWFRSYRQKQAYHRAVLDFFKRYAHQADFVFIRYPGPSKHMVKLVQLLEKRAFFEHITHEMAEIKLHANEQVFKFNLSSVLSRLEFLYLPMLHEWYFGKFMRRKAAFGICNSNEIARYENQRAGKAYIQLILGDAVNTNQFSIRTFPKFNNELKMVFLKGASTFADFNGLDRVFKGIKNYKGPVNLKFYIYGKNLKAEEAMIQTLGIQDHVELHPYTEPKVLDDIMNDIHLGISALAVHKKGIRGTTTIKTREYCARGLPFIYGHNDPDFSNNDLAAQFSLEVEANDTDLDFEKIINWYTVINQKADTLPHNMHEFALNHLDYKVKMGKLKQHIQKLNIN
jgi:hypothetical protein